MIVLTLRRLLDISDLPDALRLSILQCIMVAAWTLPSALLPVQALKLLGDAQAVSIFFFGVGFAGLIGVLATPRLIHAFGRRVAFWTGMICLVLSAVCLSVDDPLFLIVGAAARAIGFMVIDVAFEVVVMEVIPRRAMARFEAARVFFIGIGLIIGPWLGVRLALDFGDWTTYAIVGSLAITVVFYILFSDLLTKGRSAREREVPPNALRFTLRFLKQPRLRLAWLLCFGRAAWWTMYFIYVPIYCVETGLGAELGGVILSLASCALLLVPVWGRLGKRTGVRPMLGFGYLFAGVITISVATVSSPWTGIGLLLVAALGASVLDAIGNALFLRAARPLERAEMASVFFTYREAAQLIPPGILGVLLGYFALPVVFVASGIGMAVLTWFTRYIPKRF